MLIWDSMIGLAIFWNTMSLILSRFRSSWVYYWTAWSFQERSFKYLETQFKTFRSFDLSCRSTVELVELSIFFQCTVELIASRNILFVLERENVTLVDEDVTVMLCLVWTRHLFGVWRLDPSCCTWDAKVALEDFGRGCHFAWNAKVTLDHSGCRCHQKRGPPQCHVSAQFEIKICTVYLDRWEAYKKTVSLFNNHLFWLYFFIQIRDFQPCNGPQIKGRFLIKCRYANDE